jgi:prolyl-tRNA synthetase
MRAGFLRRGRDGSLAWMPPGARAIERAETLLRRALDGTGALPLNARGRAALAEHAKSLMSATGRRARALYGFFDADAENPERTLSLALCAEDSAEAGDEFDAFARALSEAVGDALTSSGLPCARGPASREPAHGFIAMAGASCEAWLCSGAGDVDALACDCGHISEARATPSSRPAPQERDGAPEAAPMIRTPTPGARTIKELGEFFGAAADRFIKSIVYRELSPKGGKARFAVACVRGDLAVSSDKLASCLGWRGAALAEAYEVEAVAGVGPGFVGPVGLPGDMVVCDDTVMSMRDAMCGGLAPDTHLERVVPMRDFAPGLVADIAQALPGSPCPACGRPLAPRASTIVARLAIARDGQAGHSENGRFVREARLEIRVESLIEALAAEGMDDAGLSWRPSIAPWVASIVPIRYSGDHRAFADALHDALEAAGVPTLLDDRDERPGVKFKDAELVGIPFRLTVGERNPPGTAELKRRDGTEPPRYVGIEDAVKAIADCSGGSLTP